MLRWALRRAEWFNLFSAFFAVIIGLILSFAWRPPGVFDYPHPFKLWALCFMIARWLGYAAVYALKSRWKEYNGWQLTVIDFNSVLGIGFAWIFLQGDSFKASTSSIVLVLIFVVLLIWNLWTNPGKKGDQKSTTIWMTPSITVAEFTVALIGFAFFLRYEAFAFPLFAMSLAYAACQRSVYNATFPVPKLSEDSVETKFMLGLAFGKIVFALYMYILFFAPLKAYPSVVQPLDEVTRRVFWGGLWTAAQWIFGSFGVQIVVGVIGGLIVWVITRKYDRK